jgi:hypothetical protein
MISINLILCFFCAYALGLCPTGCSSCSGASSNCKTCDADSFRTLVSSACPCDPGYYDAGTSVCGSNLYLF